ncbi:unnamed protein product [Linum trigynum]|uniref:Uncharacterized protein n=1 Tax=Linum trigynum TaxID=586398 RepID=A0AAV2FP77_9ROSI
MSIDAIHSLLKVGSGIEGLAPDDDDAADGGGGAVRRQRPEALVGGWSWGGTSGLGCTGAGSTWGHRAVEGFDPRGTQFLSPLEAPASCCGGSPPETALSDRDKTPGHINPKCRASLVIMAPK